MTNDPSKVKLNPEAERVIAQVCVEAVSRQPWYVLLDNKIVAIGSTEEEAEQKANALRKVSPAHYVIMTKAARDNDCFILRCKDCQNTFFYDRSKHYLSVTDPESPNGDDWMIHCPICDNWEQVGNNKPDSFEVIKRGES